jgi:peptide/nickel transport system substrate-binding protein
MQNRFGLKDGVMLFLLLTVATLVVLGMFGNDRVLEQVQQVESKVAELEGALAVGSDSSSSLSELRDELNALRDAIIARPVNVYVTGAAGGAANAPSILDASDELGTADRVTSKSSTRDESWARPGVAIDWQEPWMMGSKPVDVPGFSEGGEFTEIFGAQLPRITPYLSGDVYSRRITDQVLESMAAYDPDTLKLRGVLADAWQFDPDGLWLRVHLNPNARFSDGVPLTAEDVRWTLEDFVFNERIEAERSRSILDMIEDVEVLSDHSLEITFNKALFSNLSGALGNYILPKHYYAQFEESTINQSTGLLMGSGRFKMESNDPDNQWSPGSDVVIVRNERYWGSQKAPLESLRFKVITESVAALVGFRNGDGDMLSPSSSQYSELRSNSDFLTDNAIYKWVNMRSGNGFIGWQCGRRGGPPDGQWTPFHDKRVRRAMTMALDREQMIREIYAGVGVVSTGPSSPSSPASNPAIMPWPYSLDEARALLKEAGWDDLNKDGVLEYQLDDEYFSKGTPFKFEFTITQSGETTERIISYLVSQCEEVGIICEPRVVDWSFYSDMLKGRDFDAMIMGWSASGPESDPRQIWHRDSIQNQGDNFIQWDNQDASDLIDEGRKTMDAESRMLIWHDFHDILHEEQPYTFVRVAPWIRFINREIGNVETYPVGLEPAEFFRIGESDATPSS